MTFSEFIYTVWYGPGPSLV